MLSTMFVFLAMLLLCFKFEADGAPNIKKFDFNVPVRSPQVKRSSNGEYLVAETSHKVDMVCRDGEFKSTWTVKKTGEKVTAPFVAQVSDAGEYECPEKKINLVVKEPMRFVVTSNVDVEDSVKLLCSATVHSDRNLRLSLEIRNHSLKVIGSNSLLTQGETSNLELRIDTHKKQKEVIFSSPQFKFFSCLLNISDPLHAKTISETRKSLTVKLYSHLKNVRPNATRLTPGQPLQCLSDSIPPAHRYEWKLYKYRSETNFHKPFYISSGPILKIFDMGNHSFVCTAFNLMGKGEYSLSWVGSLQVVEGRKVGERSAIGKWVAGGSFATIVVLVAVVSYARS